MDRRWNLRRQCQYRRMQFWWWWLYLYHRGYFCSWCHSEKYCFYFHTVFSCNLEWFLFSALHFGRYENRTVSSFQTIANCQAPTPKNCMAKCVFTEQCVGYLHGSKNEMSCELISEAKVADSGDSGVTVIKADVAKLNESKMIFCSVQTHVFDKFRKI